MPNTMELKQVFESERIRFVEVSELLVKDYLVMVNDMEHVEKYLGGSHEHYNEEQEISWKLSFLSEQCPRGKSCP